MKIYDISQELLSSAVYDGDPAPTATRIRSMDEGELYNLTTLSMCVHNGTHVDAPRHFINGGKDVSDIPLEKFVGAAYVTHIDGEIDADTVRDLIRRAGEIDKLSYNRRLSLMTTSQ